MFGSRLSAAKKRLIVAALAIIATICCLILTSNRWWPLSPAEQLFVGQWKREAPNSSTHTFRADRKYLNDEDLAGLWSVSADGLLQVRYWSGSRQTLIPPRLGGSSKFSFKFRFDDSSNRVELDCVEDQTHAVLERLPQK